jgi:phospholipase/carboxylesterase
MPGRRHRGIEGLLDWLARVAPDAEAVGLPASQGGAIALQTLRLAPERIAFAVVLAGFVADGELPTDAPSRPRDPRVLGRGARDEVIPARSPARPSGCREFVELSGRVYPGLTHSVSEEELGDVRAFLQKPR